jgi:hypothetical protein
MTRIIHGWKGGFTEESLIPIEVTDELMSGKNALSWRE